ncbi:MAG: biotin transporter BioY, partial [Lachnospiraceae bacterium]|nr:biotin transporter BioY [Lachnospiraceae bacterium]
KIYMHIIGMVLGTILCYITGTLWLAYQGSMTFMEALLAGVIPFVWADAIKIAIAAIVGPKLRKALKKL